jgi:chromosome segregation ATPase
LEKIRKSEFGKTILQSLQLELKTAANNKDAVNSILNLLATLRQDEVDAQAADDTAHDAEDGDCEAYETQVQGEIDTATSTISDNNNAISLLQTAVSNSQVQLDEANDNLVTSSNALQNLQDAREAEHSTFLQDTADISATITALKNGRDILKQLEEESSQDDSSSFIQKAQGNIFSQFTSHITSCNLKQTKYHGFVTALLSMLSRDIVADQALVEMILHLIDQLVDQLSGELSTLGYNEKQAQDIFDIQETNLQSDIANLNSQIASLQSDITANNNDILDYQSDNSNLQVTINNKSQELADKEQSCTDDDTSYEAIKDQRTSEVAIIDQVINIFQTRFDNVQAYLTDNSF